VLESRPGELLRLSGNAYQRGRQQAERSPSAADDVRAAVHHRLEAVRDRMEQADIRVYLAEQKRFTAETEPAILDEIDGIADGFGIPAEDLFAYLHLGTISASDPAVSVGGCTAWAVSSSRMLAKNRDFRSEHSSIQKVFLHEDPSWDGRRLISIGSLGSPGVYSSGLNSDGLAVADTQIPTSECSVGLLRYFLMSRLLVSCSNVTEAMACIRSVKHVGGGSLILVDATGAVAAAELGPRTVATEAPTESPVARTNHFLSTVFRDENVRSRDEGGLDNSKRRLETVGRFLGMHASNVDLESAAGLMATHAGPHATALCRHGGRDGSQTISSSLYLCSSRTLFFSPGNPCTTPWQRFEMEDGVDRKDA
jgi:isopenicillin-N N-acyltransferase-like protein